MVPTEPARLDGKPATTRVEMAAMASRAQKAYNHGLSTFPDSLPPPPVVRGCEDGAGRDHLAANQPTAICAGKSSKTATARSSFDNPFSRSLREVTESLTWKPILQMRWTKRNVWMSRKVRFGVRVGGREKMNGWEGGRTFETDDTPHNLVHLFHIHIRIILTGRIFLFQDRQPHRHTHKYHSPKPHVASQRNERVIKWLRRGAKVFVGEVDTVESEEDGEAEGIANANTDCLCSRCIREVGLREEGEGPAY